MNWTLITGSSKGIGRALALKLASSGKNIAVHYRDSKKEAALLAAAIHTLGVQSEIIQGDFSSQKSIEAFISSYKKRFPNTENIIHNVGAYLIKSHLETSNNDWQTLFETNFFAPVFISRALMSSLIKYKGAIINIGVSGLNGFQAKVKSPAYNISKLALLAYTKSLAREFAKKGVRVNMISPGFIENAIDLPENIEIIPAGRPATFEEIAETADFLLKESSRYITGQNIEIAGGMNL